MILSTVDAHGCPDARVVILKAVDGDGWHFATSADSQKGRELAAHPLAALTFYWPEVVRQVRVSGPADSDGPEASAADFLARSFGTRQLALIGRQSQPLADPGEIERALEDAARELTARPAYVPEEWRSCAVHPDRVEFWQGDPGRPYQRLRYEKTAQRRWTKTLLWP